MAIQYGFLPKEHYPLLIPIFEQEGVDISEIPDPSFSRIAGAYEGTQLVGIYCLQLMQHAEPLWIHPDYRKNGTKIILNLVHMIDGIRGEGKVFIIAENKESEKMCRELGLKQIEFPVFIKESKENN